MSLLGVLYSGITNRQVNSLALLVWTLTASLIAQFGDLSMSVIRRIVGVKDFRKPLPGHGGVLDRFDSYLFVVPYTLLFCSSSNGFIP